MRYVSYLHDGRASYGLLDGDRISDLGSVRDAPPDLRAALADGALIQLPRSARSTLSLRDVQLLPPVPNPSKILCIGLNYDEHRQETGRSATEHPTIFTRFADTLVAADAPLIRPAVSRKFDYEGELAVIIGRGGRSISESAAMSHVAGFACFNDASVRDWQSHTTQFTPGKNFPATGAFGPCLVTPEEIPDLAACSLTTTLNGQQVQHAAISDMIFPIPRLIAYLSTFTPLGPGDVIATGTPGGVGARRQPPLWMQPGDLVVVEISGVGRLANRVAAEQPND